MHYNFDTTLYWAPNYPSCFCPMILPRHIRISKTSKGSLIVIIFLLEVVNRWGETVPEKVRYTSSNHNRELGDRAHGTRNSSIQGAICAFCLYNTALYVSRSLINHDSCPSKSSYLRLHHPDTTVYFHIAVFLSLYVPFLL